MLNDKCAKNHLKMRSFDRLNKMLKFDKKTKENRGKKNVLVPRRVELVTLGLQVKRIASCATRVAC